MVESIAPMVFWALSISALLITGLMALILGYHWFRYGMNAAIATFALTVFLFVSGGLLLIIFGGALAISI
jgi:uncharacterized membrane protein YqjE